MELLIDIGICLLHHPQEPFFFKKKNKNNNLTTSNIIPYHICNKKRPRIPQSGRDGFELDPVESL